MTEKEIHQCILDEESVYEVGHGLVSNSPNCLCTVCRTSELTALSWVKKCLTCGNVRIMPKDRK